VVGIFHKPNKLGLLHLVKWLIAGYDPFSEQTVENLLLKVTLCTR
jgi:hypothetical protein